MKLKSIVLLAALYFPAFPARGYDEPGRKPLSSSDLVGIRAEYQRHRQAAFAVDGGHRARNYAQQWVTRFDGRGFDVTPDSARWSWGLQLRSYGFTGEERSVQHARVRTDVEKLSYQWDSTMQEWFVNGSGGLEQGFTLSSRPGAGTSALTLHLAVRGTLIPRISQDGRWVSFLDNRGVAAIHYAGLKVTDYEGRELDARFIPEPRGIRLEVDERGARYPITIDPFAQQAYLKPAAVGTSQTGDHFGTSVSVSGDTVVVGAPQEDSSSLGINGTPNESAVSAGAAYVFVRSAGVWSQQAYLKPAAVGTSQAGDMFGISVGISGDTVVVGANSEDSSTLGVNTVPNESGSDAGAVYVFTRTAGVWSQQAYLKPAAVGTNQFSDEFGSSVAISGDTIAVGAVGESSSTLGINTVPNELASGAGAAYVFTRTAGVWSQQAYLKPAAVGTTQANDHLGNAIAVSGDILVVGAFQEDGASTGVNSTPIEGAGASGAAYVFARTAGVWSQEAYLKPAAVGSSQSGDTFGISVAASGDTVVVGANGEDSSTVGINTVPNEGGANSGAAYVFVRNAGVWSQQAFLKPAAVGTSQNGDNFGWSVAVSGDTLVVGATGEDSSTTDVNSTPNELASGAGAAYVFTRTSGVWSQQAYLKPAAVGTSQVNDQFGYAVAVSGDTVVVGAIGEASSNTGINSSPNELSADAGAVNVFTIPPPGPSLSAVKTHAGNFVQGQAGTYSVTVTNLATAGPTIGTLTVTDNFPAGLTPTNMVGTGWTCGSGNTACSRSDVLLAGASYEAIAVTVTVDAHASPGIVTNQVSLVGGGAPPANASDPTTITTRCDVNRDGNENVIDVQLMINQALGVAAANNDLNLDGAINIVDVQIDINAALGLGCSAK